VTRLRQLYGYDVRANRTRLSFQTLGHLAVNPDNGEILASEWATNEVGDLSMVGSLLDQIQSLSISEI